MGTTTVDGYKSIAECPEVKMGLTFTRPGI
jgi:hypothetical protein